MYFKSLLVIYFKIRLDKFDRKEWKRVQNDKSRFVKADSDGYWSDFDKEEKDDEIIEYHGVHPDQTETDDLDYERQLGQQYWPNTLL